MHVTDGRDRVRIWPKIAVLAALVLLASSIATGGALAAVPNWTMDVTELPSTVKPGEIAGYRVVIRNPGPSTISQVFLTNALEMTDGTTADPAVILNTAYVSPVSPNRGCDPVGVRLRCVLGSLAKNKSVTVIVAYQSPDPGTVLRVIFEANTTGVAGDNPGSSHGDALQDFGETDLNDNGNFGGRFVTSGFETVANDPTSTGNLQSTKVFAPDVAIGVTVEDGTPASWCAPACTSEASEVHVNNGELYPSGFSVEVEIDSSLVGSISIVYHQADNLTTDTITNTCPKKGKPTASQMPCFTTKNLPGGDVLVTIWNTVNGKYGF